jgi:predicted PhzF superfamily epimerase YddE/YHI9
MWLCVYERESDVAGLSPDFGMLARANPGRVIATAPGGDCDFVSRFFAPEVGVPEDPVTGSAHCTLVPYWAARLKKSSFHARQISRRGGELWCELAGDRVRMAGRCASYLSGSIQV